MGTASIIWDGGIPGLLKVAFQQPQVMIQDEVNIIKKTRET